MEEFDGLLCVLISAGHHGVFDYDYSFFKVAVKSLERVFKTHALAVTCGVGAVFDKETMKKLGE